MKKKLILPRTLFRGGRKKLNLSSI